MKHLPQAPSPIIFQAYGLNPAQCTVKAFGSGLINHTWLLTSPQNTFILQKINTAIFTRPQDIADNLRLLATYLKATAPNYLFAAPLPAANGSFIIDMPSAVFRLLPFVTGSHTVDHLTQGSQAFEAANQFGKFTSLLNNFNANQLKYTLPNFHNLSLRINQFKQALADTTAERQTQAAPQIQQVQQYFGIADVYEQLTQNNEIPLRVIHHDTKINNVLLDDNDKGMAVIDLDTVMPGYFISDVGDMMRTYLAEANEEEQDLDKISIRTDFFAAIYSGYMHHMGSILTPRERQLFIYAGRFMIYMQAVRFLTDFLNGDIYYPVKYTGHNLQRAKNQLRLLELYIQYEPAFEKIIKLSKT